MNNKFAALFLITAFLALSFMANAEAISEPYNSSQSDGDLIKVASSNDVYIVKIYGGKRFKRLILNPAIFNQYQHLRWENIQLVSQDIFDSYINSNLVRLDRDANVWQLYPSGDTGVKRWIPTAQQLTALGCDGDGIFTINIFEYNSYVIDTGTLNQCPSSTLGNLVNGSNTSNNGSTNSGAINSGNGGIYYYNPSFLAEYYDVPAGASFPPQFPSGLHLSRGEKEINYNWGTGVPLEGINADNFAVRWTKNMYLPSGTHTFTFVGDDGFRVWAGNTLLIDKWHDQTTASASADYYASGGNVMVKIEYYDHLGAASAKFSITKKN